MSSTDSDEVWDIEPVGESAYWLICRSQGGDLPFPADVDVAELDPSGPTNLLMLLCDMETDQVLQAVYPTNQLFRAAAVDPDGSPVLVMNTVHDVSFPFVSPGSPFGGPGPIEIAKLDPLGERWVQVHAFGAGSSDPFPYEAKMFSPSHLYMVGDANGGFPTTPDAVDPVIAGASPYDGFFSILDLTPDGVERYGPRTDGCTGECRISLRALPYAGEGDFGLACVGAPRSTPGVFAIGLGPTELPLVGGATLLIDPVGSVVLPVFSDTIGRSGVDLPLTSIAAGTAARFQFIWLDLGACGQVGATYASDALAVTVQPAVP